MVALITEKDLVTLQAEGSEKVFPDITHINF
jgi:hypothetical protein